MSHRCLLPLATYPDVNSDVVISNAISAVQLIGASLHILAVTVDIPAVSSAFSEVLLGLPDKIKAAEAGSRARAEHLLDVARRRSASPEGTVVTLEQASAAVTLVNEFAAERARYFDFALVGWEASNPTSWDLAEAVVFESGRPTIILPELRTVGTGHSIAIAWDGSRTAARAVADARPFLERAKLITVVTVVDEKQITEKQSARTLAHKLCETGFAAEALEVSAQRRSISTAIQDAALETEADLLVMGGYGHSRIREFVLGGATQGILADLRLPILMSH